VSLELLGVFAQGDKMTIILQGLPCSWGKCVFCPFALEQTVNLNQLLENNKKIIDKAVSKIGEDIRRVVVFNGGSFSELPLDTVLRLAPLAKDRVFEIEERSEFVDLGSVERLYRMFEPRKIVIRVGFEVIDEKIRNEYLRKGMSDNEMYRLSSLRIEARKKGIPLEIWTYVLFGIKGIEEDIVRKSIEEFKKLFDGVIAIKYHKYLKNHPEPQPVTQELLSYLRENADEVDLGGEIWNIGGIVPE
jgi:uncharacterized Fe-S cluster-containing MiaB family protein